MTKKELDAAIDLLKNGVVRKKELTAIQMLMVLLCHQNDGMTQRELAKSLGITEPAVSANYKALGPAGSNCLKKEGKLVKPSDEVAALITETLARKDQT